ncbi:MAG: copper ion binding protein, partial [Myxococcales bacterium]|nr:copper ion binding protein [Myxococcales bacterium]
MTADSHACLVFPVEGMTCATCAGRIEKVVGRLGGVASARVNLASEKARVEFDDGQVGAQEIVAAIERAGFSVPTDTIRLRIEGMTCATCSQRVEKVLRKQPGVASAQVNLATEVATVAVTPGVATVDALVEAVEAAGYGASPAPSDAASEAAEAERARREARRELSILAASTALTLPLVLPMLAMPFGLDLALPGLVQLLLATPVQVLVGARFYRAAYHAIRAGSGNMDTLVALGTSAAFALSLVTLARGGHHFYFEASATVITLVLLGKSLESKAKRSTTAAVRALMSLRPARARVRRDGREVEVAPEAVGRGDVVIVKPGERLPVDGVILRGRSQLDESLITGES